MTAIPTDLGNPDHFGGANVYAKRPTIKLRAGFAGVVTTYLLVNGVPVDLAAYGFGSSEVGGFSEPLPNIQARITEYSSQNGETIVVDLLNATTAKIQFTVPDSILAKAGIWIIEFYIVDQSSNKIFVNDAYLNIELSGLSATFTGPPTVPEVRLFLRDYAQENELLDAVDFDGSEIAFAADMCVNEWNEADPWDGPHYTTQTFQFRRNWLIGMCGYLFSIAADHYARNQMQKDMGQLAYDDKAKYQIYQQKSMAARQEWMAFVASRKTVLAAQTGFAEINGVYYGW